MTDASEKLYQVTKRRAKGSVPVSDGHKIYYEEYGRKDGEPVFIIHGGPGGKPDPEDVRFHDPERYRIVVFHQRGVGNSTPHASLENNTTQGLVDDIVRLRKHLGIHGKMHLLGGSWGSTLSLVYAIQYPETVQSMTLRGIFLCRKQDIDYFYQGDAADPKNPALMGAGRFFPDEWEIFVNYIPLEERDDMVAAYYRRLTSTEPKTRMQAAKKWSIWEGATSKLRKDDSLIEKFNADELALAMARIECHYFINGIFLSKENSRKQNYIIDHIDRIADIPTTIIHGQYDQVCPRNQADDLFEAWQNIRPHSNKWQKIITTAGHSRLEPETLAELIKATRSAPRLEKDPLFQPVLEPAR